MDTPVDPGGLIDREPRGLRPPHDMPDPDRHRRYGTESTDQWRQRVHADALAALLEPLAGLPVTDYEYGVLRWLAGWETSTVAVVAALLHRARRAGVSN